jgi:phenylalanyl-tRNA synthetase alpha chain
MEGLMEQLATYRKEIEGYKIANPQQLEEYRIKFLGTKGILKSLFGEMKNVPADRKKEAGQVLNEFKQLAEAKYEEAKQLSTGNGQEAKVEIDVTLPGDGVEIGARHPITLMRNRIVSIFQRLGFSVADGPEIETTGTTSPP